MLDPDRTGSEEPVAECDAAMSRFAVPRHDGVVGWLTRGRRPRTCRICGHASEAPLCSCPREDCGCRAARRVRYAELLSTLSPHDQAWVKAHRPRLEQAIARGDMVEMRRILDYQLQEAEDPDAMHRFFQTIIASRPPDRGD